MYPAWTSCIEKKRRDRKVTMQVWPTHLISRQKKLKNYPATATGLRSQARKNAAQRVRKKERKKKRTRVGDSRVPRFSLCPYCFIARELSWLNLVPRSPTVKGKGVRVRSGYEITLDSLLFIAPATQAMRFGREAPANFIIRKKVFTTLLKYTQKSTRSSLSNDSSLLAHPH